MAKPPPPPVEPYPPDPILEAELDRATAPYRDLLSAEALQDMRDALEAALLTSPVGMRLMAAVRPPPVVLSSDELERDGAQVKPKAAARAKKTRGGSK